MNKNLFNEDYIKGMRLLLKESKIQGVNIRKARWIPSVSKKLSEHNLCYKFWFNTCNQNNIERMLKCDNWYDLLYNFNMCAFLWMLTSESSTFWREKLSTMLDLDIDGDFIDPIDYSVRLMNMKL